VDTLPDKYPSLSPYMYTAGNPVMLVDPDGNYLVIWYKVNGHMESFIFKGNNANKAPKNQKEA